MLQIASNLEDLIGNTPLYEPKAFSGEYALKARLLTKLEQYNPAGSVKDRVAYAMIVDAEQRGLLKPGATIIEPTSGNTGIGLAAVGAARGYRVILTMPENMSVERRRMIAVYGAEIVLTDERKGMRGAIEKANELQAQHPGSYIPAQFDNPVNARTHYETTGPEIWTQTQGALDLFVASVGTGGTLTGISHYLREKDPSITVVAVEPLSSNVLSGGKAGPHKIQGIGAGFVPAVLDTKAYQRVAAVSNEDAFVYARSFIRTEGISVGISSGAALAAAVAEAQKDENAGKTIVTLLPDLGDRYLSTPLAEQ